VTVNINLISAKHKLATVGLAAEFLSTFRTEAHFTFYVCCGELNPLTAYNTQYEFP